MDTVNSQEVRSPLVLAVDDDQQVLELGKLILERGGFRVVAATTGGEAIKAAEEMQLDLILLDVGLPDMDGTLVCQRIRAFSQTPIIEVSGQRTTASDIAAVLDKGAVDYLIKPFSHLVLVAKVKAALRRAGSSVAA
ncbi:MAG: response regulator transcription factor [Chloroflexota bacterium]|nr:response regulator transcription factor [Chloroflexota bacterium]